MLERPRRNRSSATIRTLVRETELSPTHLVLPVFVQDGQDCETPIASMPGQARLSIDRLLGRAQRWLIGSRTPAAAKASIQMDCCSGACAL
jgi:delta-aminolevulinic acid dehydratase/porphobilinogen synthase